MGLELLEFQIFQNQVQGPSDPGTLEIDLPKSVPAGETWRVDRISALVLVPGGLSDAFVIGQPILFVYDKVNPGPTDLPVDETALGTYPTYGQQNPPPLGSNGTIYYLDADDLTAPITLLAGFQLGLVFYAPWQGTSTPWQASARIQYSRYAGTGGRSQPVAT